MRKIILAIFLMVAPAMAAQVASGFTKISNATTTTFTDATCPLMSTCGYQVTAVDASGFESAVAACSSTQLCIGGNIAVAIMPSSGTHSVALSWTASTSTGVSYVIYRHIGPLPAANLSVTVN
jgi:fibronectin type 3 domain-containing protein